MVEKQLSEQVEANKKLKKYMGDVLVNVMASNPQILEKNNWSEKWLYDIEELFIYCDLDMIMMILFEYNNKYILTNKMNNALLYLDIIHNW